MAISTTTGGGLSTTQTTNPYASLYAPLPKMQTGNLAALLRAVVAAKREKEARDMAAMRQMQAAPQSTHSSAPGGLTGPTTEEDNIRREMMRLDLRGLATKLRNA